jgi:hypothetical protein
MKKLIVIPAVLFVAALAQAALVSVTGANWTGATVDSGSVATGGTVPAETFTISNLTIDDDGANNDSIIVLLSISGSTDFKATASTITWGTDDQWHNNTVTSIAAGDSMKLVLSLQSYALSDVSKSLVADFDITACGVIRGNNPPTTTDKADVYYDDVLTDSARLMNNGTLSTTVTGADSIEFINAGGNFSINALDFDVTTTVIPEPATLGLVAAFGGAVLFIRRRFMI